MAGGGGRRWGLLVLGALLLISSAGVIGYSRVAEWQHAVEVRSLAPPPQSLPERLAIPTRSSR